MAQLFLDPRGEEFALVKHGLERAGEARDDQGGRVRTRDDDGLFVQRGEDVLDQSLGHPQGLRPYQRDQPASPGLADLGRGPEPLQEHQDGRVLDPRAEDSLQVRVDLRQQAAQAVAAVCRRPSSRPG
ncbi:hypothetical protein GCM10010347_27020 [Streptomyces cirratus]|uniref:Uncharacterized protein n=1 Tax=Streptomyces cirratus TaxID=68187 RepID=A0ABQ3ETU0_9ACTN|nr:hypothetical protein GCM10010347_27020 [Streptomyces cirratus]